MRKEFLGRGWKFPFRVDPATGAIAKSEYEQNIKECMTLIIGTKLGERQMLPEFGCRIHELMFTPNTPALASVMGDYVGQALKRWEPRIEVKSVDAYPDAAGSVRVQVNYAIRATSEDLELDLTLNNSG